MLDPATVGGEVDRRRDEARVLERLEDSHCPFAEMVCVHVDHRVPQRAADAGGTDGTEGRAVFDEPALGTAVPDEMGDLVHVWECTCRQRRQADRCQRREDGDRPAVRAELEQRRERRRRASLDSSLQHRRRQAVDDGDDQLLPLHGYFASVRRPAYRSAARRRTRNPKQRHDDAFHVADDGHERQRCDHQPGDPDESRGAA